MIISQKMNDSKAEALWDSAIFESETKEYNARYITPYPDPIIKSCTVMVSIMVSVQVIQVNDRYVLEYEYGYKIAHSGWIYFFINMAEAKQIEEIVYDPSDSCYTRELINCADNILLRVGEVLNNRRAPKVKQV